MLNFLLTSLELYQNPLINYLSDFNQTIIHSFKIGKYHSILYGDEAYLETINNYYLDNSSWKLLCSSNDIHDEFMYQNIIDIENNILHRPKSPISDSSCVIFDIEENKLWLYSDIINRIPLWYSFHNKIQNNEFVATNDYFLAKFMNFTDMSVVSSGSTISINSNTYQIIHYYIHDISKISQTISDSERSLQLFNHSSKLFQNTKLINLNNFYSILLNDIDSLSLLTECVLNNISITNLFIEKSQVEVTHMINFPELKFQYLKGIFSMNF